MKKIKSLLLVCMAALMMLAIPLAAACKTDDTDGDGLTLESIQLNLDNAKTTYIVGESYTSEGVEVIATLKNSKGETEDRTVTDSATFDSSAFKSNAAGKYTINVSYALDGESKATSYDVTVAEAREGLLVTHSDGTRSKTFDIDADNPTITIDPSDIKVEYIEFGQSKGAISDYTVKVYKEAVEITDYSGLGSGTYQIWVSKESSTTPGFILEDFVLIYVVEEIVAFNWVRGTTTQNIGIDNMTPTWEYTVTYATSSTPRELTKEEVAGSVTVTGVNVLRAGDRTATATYTYYKADGKKATLTAKIPYTVTDGNLTRDTKTFTWVKNANYADGTAIAQSDLDAMCTSSFLTIMPAGIVNYRESTSPGQQCIEVRGDALKVTFKGVGTLVVSARSTGAGNHSSIGLVKYGNDETEFEYISGSYTSSSVQQIDYYEGPMYQVTGDGYSEITFTIREAGEYIICTNDEAPDGDSIYNRNTRIQTIVKNDIYEKDVAEATSIINAVGKISEINLYNNGSKD